MLAESKGCSSFAVNEKQFTVALSLKKKLCVYSWQQPNFVPRKEFTLQDIPKGVWCYQNVIIVGYRKFYDSIEPNSGLVSRVLDFEREHKMICAEVREVFSFFLFPFLFRHARLHVD